MADDGYVKVPREHLNHYWFLPWAEVVDAAERGENGITRMGPLAGRNDWTRPIPNENNAEAVAWFDANYGFAYLCEGEGRQRGTARLYQQNW